MKIKVGIILKIVFFMVNLILCIFCITNIFKAFFIGLNRINPIMDIGLGIVFAWNTYESCKQVIIYKNNRNNHH